MAVFYNFDIYLTIDYLYTVRNRVRKAPPDTDGKRPNRTKFAPQVENRPIKGRYSKCGSNLQLKKLTFQISCLFSTKFSRISTGGTFSEVIKVEFRMQKQSKIKPKVEN